MLAAIQQWWRDVGVEMTPRFVDFPTILDTQDTHDFQVMNLAFSWTPPFWDQGAMFNTASYEGGFNHMKYSNEEFDRLDEEQRRELDPEKRREILIEQANIVNEDLPVGVLLFRDNRVGYSDGSATTWPATSSAVTTGALITSTSRSSSRPRSHEGPRHAPLHHRRLLLMIPLLLGITFMVFAIVNLVPGSPVAQFEANLGSQQDIERIRSNLGLDEPWPKRYVIWVGNLLGDSRLFLHQRRIGYRPDPCRSCRTPCC